MADLGPGMGHLFPVCRNEIPAFLFWTAAVKQHRINECCKFIINFIKNFIKDISDFHHKKYSN